MNQIFLSLYATFIVQIHSKRMWALITAIVTIVTSAYFQAYQQEALEIVALLAVWMTSDTLRPSGGENSATDLVAQWREASRPTAVVIEKGLDYDPRSNQTE